MFQFTRPAPPAQHPKAWQFHLYNHIVIDYSPRMRRLRILLITLALLPLPALADETGNPPTFPQSTAADGVLGQAQEFALRALSFIGVRYKWGGNSPDTGFDCSGLIRYVYSQITGQALPRNAHDLSAVGETVDRTELQPGDLVFFNTLRRAFSHVGIYVGDGKFIHSPKPGAQVRVENMSISYWASRFDGARRVASSGNTLTNQTRQTALLPAQPVQSAALSVLPATPAAAVPSQAPFPFQGSEFSP